MKSSTQNQSKHTLVFLEKLLLVGLLIPTIFSFYNTMNEFLEKKTVVGISKKPLTADDIPTATVCFMDQMKLEYGKDIKIYILTSRTEMPDDKTEIIALNKGKNVYQHLGERQAILTELVIQPNPVLGTKSCFKITLQLISEFYMNAAFNSTHLIGMFFIDLTEDVKNITEGMLIVTSEKNSYGAVTGQWYDGDVEPFALKKGNYHLLKIPKIRRYEFEYLRPSCSEKSFYECFTSKLHLCHACLENGTTCSPFSLPSIDQPMEDLPICKQAKKCLVDCTPKLRRCLDQMPCSQQDYSLYEGKVYESGIKNMFDQLAARANNSNVQMIAGKQNKIFQFTLILDNLDWRIGRWTETLHVDVYTESYVWTGFTLIGNIGGNMGLWAGFSFPGMIAWLSLKLAKF